MAIMQLMQLKYLTHLKQRWKSRVVTQTTIALLGGLGGLAGLEILTAPAVQAYEARLSVTLDREKDETFQTLVKRGEVVARAAVQQAFDTDILATDVSVFINGRSGGLEAPLLSIQISRFQWQSFPDTRQWATYYPSTQSLLRLESPVLIANPNGAVNSQPQPSEDRPESAENNEDSFSLSNFTFRADGWVIGTVTNLTGRPVDFVQVNYEALGANRELIGTGSFFTNPSSIPAGGSSNFSYPIQGGDGAATARITGFQWRWAD